jgi:hypothetical protein
VSDSGDVLAREGRQSCPLMLRPEGVEECAVDAVIGESRNGPWSGTWMQIVSRVRGFRTVAGQLAGNPAVAGMRCLQPGAGLRVGRWSGASGNAPDKASPGLTTALTRVVVPLPLPRGADLVSGAVSAWALAGVETK